MSDKASFQDLKQKLRGATEFVQETDELDIVFGGPAVASNKFYINVSAGGIRITFAESAEGLAKAKFRSAVMLSFQDAISFSGLIAKVVDEHFEIAEAKRGGGDGSGTEE